MFKMISLCFVLLFSRCAFGDAIFKENFESDSIDNASIWLQNQSCNEGTTLRIAEGLGRKNSNCLEIHYILDDNPRGDCQLHQDNNTCLVYNISQNLTHYFFRGYFKIHLNNASRLCSSPIIQRKLLYFKPQNYNSGGWSFFIVAWPWGHNCNQNGYCISLAHIGNGAMGETLWGDGSTGFVPQYNHVLPDIWYYLEVEVEYRVFGEDIMRIWFGPEKGPTRRIFERTDLSLRSETDVASNVGLGILEVGRQVDIARTQFDEGWIDEYRYWDDIILSTDFNGLIEDVNQDGSVDINDVQLVVNVILGKAENSRADVNRDGSVTISDTQEVVNSIIG